MDLLEFTAQPSSVDDLYVQQKKEWLEERILIFNEEVSDDALEDLALYILRFNCVDKDLPIEKRKKIKIYFSSTGGDTFVAQNIIDVIMASKTPIIGVAFSLTASAAYNIYLACHERICFKTSIFLQHDGSISVSNSSKKASETFAFLQDLEDTTKQFVISQTNMTEEFYDKIYDTEYWMLAQKAKELGVVHKIIGEDVDIDYIY